MGENGYDATMRLARERPDLLPLLTIMLGAQNLMDENGVEWFSDGVDELLQRGIIEVAYLSPESR